jgi:phage terminase large subunit-like protein
MSAERVTKFVQTLRQSKGEWAGKPLLLLPWQVDIVGHIYGTLRPDGNRQYRTAFIEVPRKNGKSSLCAALALYHLIADGESGAEVYLAAVDRDQAAIVFGIAADMVRQHPALRKRLQVVPSTRRIVDVATSSMLRVIASDAGGSHGFNASCVIADEVHAWPSRELWDVLSTSTGARRQPLMIGITTAGFESNSLGGQLHEYAERVRDGVVDDPSFLPVLYGAEPDEPWDDPAVWRKANPSLGHTVSEEYLAGECARAKAVPAYESAFRRLHLCQWVNQETRYLPMEAWADCAGGVTFADLEAELDGEVCYGGLDLSATTDMTALVLVFPRGDGRYDVVPRFWLPGDDIKRRSERDRVPYDVWARQGLLTLTPGNVVDYAHVRAEVNALARRYVIGGISYDRWAATQLVQELVADGIDMAPMSQGMASMAAPTSALLQLTLGRKLRHANHPILRWQADNLVVISDAAGNVRPAKHKARQRIDGIVALIMGIDRASRNAGAGASVYEERGMLVL